MTFKLVPDATFVSTVQIPNGDVSLPLKVIFRRKSKEALTEFTSRVVGLDDMELCTEILEGWEDVEEGYSRDALEKLLKAYSGAALAIYMRYLDSHARAERKN
jgi:hypothetical protein